MMKMMMNNRYGRVLTDDEWFLFLDDFREVSDKYPWITGRTLVARTYGEFVNAIEAYGLPTIVAFDHDLGDNKTLLAAYPKQDWYSDTLGRAYTGADAARYLAQYCIDNKKPIPSYMVHTDNPAGGANIHSILRTARKVTDEEV